MGKIHQFESPQGKKNRRVAFTQDELRQVFNVYSRRVSTGEWRDYAIGHYDGRAIFSVFRHTADKALYAIEKQGSNPGEKGGQFVLMSGRESLKKSKLLSDVLAVIATSPRLVVSN